MNPRNFRVLRHLIMMVLMAMGCVQECAAHGFGERYDLPVPMLWVSIAACCVVALSFCLTPFLRSNTNAPKDITLELQVEHMRLQTPHLSSLSQSILMALSCSLLFLVWSCASFGIQDPLMNLAPTFIWIIWWLGTSFACLLFGNIWRLIDPWMGLYLAITHLKAMLFGQSQSPLDDGVSPVQTQGRLRWPESIGRWPACFTLLIWCGLEIIYPIASMPERLGAFIAFYSLYTWLGMFTFGLKQWRLYADGFTLYFEFMALLRQQLISMWNAIIGPALGTGHTPKMNSLNSKPIEHRQQVQRLSIEGSQHNRTSLSMSMSMSMIGLVMAMFSSVLFDGLHAAQGWLVFERWATHLPFFQHDINGYFKGALGLLMLWLSLSFIYLLTCHLTQRMFFLIPHYPRFRSQLNFNTIGLASSFLSCLLPIAVAYLIAHNFSSFFIQGQNIIALASDPYGLGWDLWGTAHFYPDITLIDAKLTWYVASISIVLGHVISIFMAHQTACALSAQLREVSLEAMLQEGGHHFEFTTIKPWILNIPMTLVMIGFTALSLSIIAEPLTNSPVL